MPTENGLTGPVTGWNSVTAGKESCTLMTLLGSQIFAIMDKVNSEKVRRKSFPERPAVVS